MIIDGIVWALLPLYLNILYKLKSQINDNKVITSRGPINISHGLFVAFVYLINAKTGVEINCGNNILRIGNVVLNSQALYVAVLNICPAIGSVDWKNSSGCIYPYCGIIHSITRNIDSEHQIIPVVVILPIT
jgi:hypothetical protein